MTPPTMTTRERLEAVLLAEANAIRGIVVTPAYDQAAQDIAHVGRRKRKVITTGMGKAGLIAQKTAATLCATGTPALFLHPGEASHGDLGVIGDGDLILAFSHSGKTREVLELLEASRQLAIVSVIAITASEDAEIARYCDQVLAFGPIEEPCPFGVTPSASTAAMVAIGDALALAAMVLNGITRGELALRHRGGYLGAQLKERS